MVGDASVIYLKASKRRSCVVFVELELMISSHFFTHMISRQDQTDGTYITTTSHARAHKLFPVKKNKACFLNSGLVF